MTGPINPPISRSGSGTGFCNWGFLFLPFVIDFLKVLLIFFPGCSDRASLASLAKSLWEVDLPQVYVIKCFSWMYLPLRLTWAQAQFKLFSYILSNGYRALKLGLIKTPSRLCSLRPDFGRNADWLLEQSHKIRLDVGNAGSWKRLFLCFRFALPAGMLLQSETKIEPDLRLVFAKKRYCLSRNAPLEYISQRKSASHPEIIAWQAQKRGVCLFGGRGRWRWERREKPLSLSPPGRGTPVAG